MRIVVCVDGVSPHLALQDLQRLPQAAGQTREFAAAEEKQHDKNDDCEMPTGKVAEQGRSLFSCL